MKIEEIDKDTLRVELECKFNWKYEKFKGDMAIYAICPICNFHHHVGQVEFGSGDLVIDIQYLFCPACGEFLYNDEDSDCTYNERSVEDLYSMEVDNEIIQSRIEQFKNDFYGEDEEELTEEQKEYLKKWDKFTKDELIAEETRWSDFLWLGRHSALKDTIIKEYLNSNDENLIKIAMDAINVEKHLIEKYQDDNDFIRCLVDVEKSGDKEWEEILNNVGSLRYILSGEWCLDS